MVIISMNWSLASPLVQTMVLVVRMDKVGDRGGGEREGGISVGGGSGGGTVGTSDDTSTVPEPKKQRDLRCLLQLSMRPCHAM